MLKPLLGGLLAANLAFFAWTQGWLTGLVGVSPDGDREPQRLSRQVQAEAVQLLPPGTLARRTPPPVCVESGPYTPAELGRAEGVLRAALSEGSWQLITRERPGQWMVYMGPYTSKESMQRRIDDLRKKQVAFEEVRNLPEYEPGLMFGRYTSESDARTAVSRLQALKVRFARPVRLVAPTTSHTLRLPRANAETQANLGAMREAMGGKPWTACNGP